MLSAERLFAKRLLAWYDRSRRNLPWRLAPDARADARLDPYHVLVSETMLQQTQVATVIPYFHRFLAHFPTVAALAEADEQEVLRLWQGLGYYSRARNLHRAAQVIVARHSGKLPGNLQALHELPGVGRYTAGAVASIAFNLRAPILDGNVARVLCRVDRIESDARDRETVARLWERAEEILPRARFGDFNSALMELGATVCTPRKPQCLICPVREHCEAFAAGVQDRIPPPRKAIETPLLQRWTLCIRRRRDDRWLIEQRPPRGRWAGMWQFVTVEPAGQKPTRATVRRAAGLQDVTPPNSLGIVTHGLTHRRYRFEVFACTASTAGAAAADDKTLSAPASGQRRWIHLAELPNFPFPRPHLKVAGMLAELLMGT